MKPVNRGKIVTQLMSGADIVRLLQIHSFQLQPKTLIGELLILLFDTENNFLRKCTVNLLKPTGYVMHQQFNIQQLYALPTLYLCVLYLSQNKQRLVPLTA